MKRNKLLFLLGFAMLFVACSNEADSLVESASDPATISLDLQSLNYDDLANVLSNVMNAEETVMLKDGSESWTIHLKYNKNIVIEEQGNQTYVFDGVTDENVDASLSSNCAILRLQKNGEFINYIAYKDKEEMKRIANYYQTKILPNLSTRSLEDNKIVTCIMNSNTRSHGLNIESVKINITKAIASNPLKANFNNDCCVVKSERSESKNTKAETRNWGMTPPMLEFILLREEGSNYVESDVTVQVIALMKSIQFLKDASFAQYYFSIYDIPYKVMNTYPESAAYEFRNYLRRWDMFADQGDKIFILLRSEDLDQKTLGVVPQIGAININNPATNFEMCAICNTTIVYPCTMAHEVGHLLGAEHVDDDTDLMYRFAIEGYYPYHKDDNNIEVMKSNLTLNN